MAFSRSTAGAMTRSAHITAPSGDPRRACRHSVQVRGSHHLSGASTTGDDSLYLVVDGKNLPDWFIYPTGPWFEQIDLE